MNRISATALRTENRTKPSNNILSDGNFTTSLTESIARIVGRIMKNMFEFVFAISLLSVLVNATRKILVMKEPDRNFLLLNKLYFGDMFCWLDVKLWFLSSASLWLFFTYTHEHVLILTIPILRKNFNFLAIILAFWWYVFLFMMMKSVHIWEISAILPPKS